MSFYKFCLPQILKLHFHQMGYFGMAKIENIIRHELTEKNLGIRTVFRVVVIVVLDWIFFGVSRRKDRLCSELYIAFYQCPQLFHKSEDSFKFRMAIGPLAKFRDKNLAGNNLFKGGF